MLVESSSVASFISNMFIVAVLNLFSQRRTALKLNATFWWETRVVPESALAGMARFLEEWNLPH